MRKEKMYFMNCNLAGRMYHEADEVWNELRVGTRLRLERDEENRYDPKAVAVMYDNPETDERPYWVTSLPIRTSSFLLSSTWVGSTFSNAASAKSTRMFIPKSRFSWSLK